MGHEVDSLGYNQIMRDESYARKEYLKAESMLNLLSSTRPYGQVEEEKLEEQEKQIQSLKVEVEKLRSEKREAEDITIRLEMLVRDLIARVERIEANE